MEIRLWRLNWGSLWIEYNRLVSSKWVSNLQTSWQFSNRFRFKLMTEHKTKESTANNSNVIQHNISKNEDYRGGSLYSTNSNVIQHRFRFNMHHLQEEVYRGGSLLKMLQICSSLQCHYEKGQISSQGSDWGYRHPPQWQSLYTMFFTFT